MTLLQLLDKYNKKLGTIVPGLATANAVELCSLKDVIDNSRELSFKVSLFPSDAMTQLVGFDDTAFTESLITLESNLSNILRWIAFYPKYNITFEKMMHTPIINLEATELDPIVESAQQIPISVTYYVLFNNTLNTIKRYYNSNIFFDHTAYMAIPSCISDQYNLKDLFVWTGGSTTPYPLPDIWNYGLDFTNAENFKFSIDDADILAQTKNIVFVEVALTTQMTDFDFYMMINSGNDIYVRKGKVSKLTYRKVFYNVDFINIKNRLVKYSA